MHHKPLMMRAKSNENSKFVSGGSRNHQAGSLRSPDPGPNLDCKQPTRLPLQSGARPCLYFFVTEATHSTLQPFVSRAIA